MSQTDKSAKNQGYLMDIAALRIILIVLLVLTHAVAIHAGGWKKPYEGIPDNRLYYWIGKIIISMSMQTMTFISGAVFGYILFTKPERFSAKYCIWKKVKRILVPSIIFSILYFFIIEQKPFVVNDIYEILMGKGHMWFLPMLFWCFVFTYILEVLRTPPYIVLIASALVLAVPVLYSLPLRIGLSFNYFFFFYWGFCLKKQYIKFPKLNAVAVVALFVVWIAALLGEMSIPDIVTETGIKKYALIIAKNTLRLVSVVSIILVILYLTLKPKVNEYFSKYPVLIVMSTYCYGVYIFQQFVLKYLFYNTPFCSYLGSDWFPLVGFLIGLVASILLTHLTLKTRVGRYLIG